MDRLWIGTPCEARPHARLPPSPAASPPWRRAHSSPRSGPSSPLSSDAFPLVTDLLARAMCQLDSGPRVSGIYLQFDRSPCLPGPTRAALCAEILMAELHHQLLDRWVWPAGSLLCRAL